jgi:hypothetical protein
MKRKITKRVFSVSPFPSQIEVKLRFCENSTIFSEITTIDLSYVVPVKSKVEISQKVLAFSEYMNSTRRNVCKQIFKRI